MEDTAADASPPAALRFWQIAVLVVLAVGILGLAVFAAIVAVSGDDETEPSPPGVPPPAGSIDSRSVRDGFDRPDTDTSLGRTPTGQDWRSATGVWGIEEGAAHVVTPNAKGPRSMALLDLGASDGSVTVEAGRMVAGWGIVFRWRGELDYWMLTAAPKFASYNVGRVVGGELQSVAKIEMQPMEPGTSITIRFQGDVVEVSVNQKVVSTTKGVPSPEDATFAGLVAQSDAATRGTWRSFSATADPTRSTSPPAAATTTVG